MTTERITFAAFSQLLERLGFEARRVDANGPKVLFVHPATDTRVVVREMRPSALVPAGDLIAARYVLDGRGVVDENAFDEMLAGCNSAKV
jgi:hypothetical protein